MHPLLFFLSVFGTFAALILGVVLGRQMQSRAALRVAIAGAVLGAVFSYSVYRAYCIYCHNVFKHPMLTDFYDDYVAMLRESGRNMEADEVVKKLSGT